MILDLSLGEFTALVGKAFRGAGYPWGLANDGAYAAGVLAQNGLPAAAIVARLLAVVEHVGFDSFTISEPATTEPGKPQGDAGACPICLGVALSDLGQLDTAQFAAVIGPRPVFEPVLLAAWLPNCRIDWEQGHVTINPAGIQVVGAQPPTSTAITISALDESASELRPESTSQLSTRAAVARPAFKKLLGLAARTYAPATDESRTAGAG